MLTSKTWPHMRRSMPGIWAVLFLHKVKKGPAGERQVAHISYGKPDSAHVCGFKGDDEQAFAILWQGQFGDNGDAQTATNHLKDRLHLLKTVPYIEMDAHRAPDFFTEMLASPH